MPCICAFILTLDWANLPQALIFCLTEFLVVYVWLFIGCEKVIHLLFNTIFITLNQIESFANCEYFTYKMGLVFILLGLEINKQMFH